MFRRWPTWAKRARDEKGRELSRCRLTNVCEACSASARRDFLTGTFTFLSITSRVCFDSIRLEPSPLGAPPSESRKQCAICEGGSVKATKNFLSHEDTFYFPHLECFLLVPDEVYLSTYVRKKSMLLLEQDKINISDFKSAMRDMLTFDIATKSSIFYEIYTICKICTKPKYTESTVCECNSKNIKLLVSLKLSRRASVHQVLLSWK